MCVCLFFFKQKTAYELRISDWSSDVCSSDLSAFRTFTTGGTTDAFLGMVTRKPSPFLGMAEMARTCSDSSSHQARKSHDRSAHAGAAGARGCGDARDVRGQIGRAHV